ncbi:MAG: hypothetical protein K5868_07355 [Lachnospiraceae bacterium]|nr:hypothetical protein [Lachnospiraceae bacterium]
MWTKENAIKTISCITATALAAGAIGVAYVNTTLGIDGIRLAGITAQEESILMEEAEASPEKQADLLQNIIATQVGTTGSDVDKEESVYVVADAAGCAKEVIVSDWLKNEVGAKTITDTSDLKDITNVKGDETYTIKGDELVWDAEGSDIYYQGTTDKALPVDMNITYYLDGKEISAEDLVGKSGDVKIRFDYSNNATYEADIKGEETEVYVPFTTMTAMMLPTDRFTDVTVTNGKVMSEGNNNIVLGLAFPGLTDSLDLDREELADKDIEIPEYFEVEAKVNDFKLDMTLTVALSDALSDIHLTDSIDLSSVEESVDDLKDATGQLEDGSKALADGVKTLSEKTGEFSDGAGKLANGITEYTDGASALASGIDTLKNGTSELSEGAAKLSDGANTLSAGAKELNDKVQAISLPEMSGLTDEQKAGIAAAAAADSDGRIAVGASQVADGITSQIAGNISGSIDGDALASDITSSISEAITNSQLQEGIAAALKSSIPDGEGNSLLSDDQAFAIAGNILSTIDGNVSSSLGSGIASSVSGKISAIPSGITSDETKAAVAAGVKDAMTQAAQGAAVAGAEGVMGQVGSTMSGYAPMIQQLKDGTAALANGASEVANGASALSDGAGRLDSGVGELKSGADKLVGNNDALKDGAGQLADGSKKLSDGVGTLLTGANDLSNGMVRFDKEGIDKLTSSFEDEGEKVVDRLNATMDAAKSYHSFSGLADGKEGNVKFIIRTEAIK